MKTRFNITKINTLNHACAAAADKYRENAEVFRKLIDYKPSPNELFQVHGVAARRTAEMFEAQAKECDELVAIFADCADFIVVHGD